MNIIRSTIIFIATSSLLLAEFRVGARSHGAMLSDKYNYTQGTSSFSPAFFATGFIHWATKVFKYHYFFIGPYAGSGKIFPKNEFDNTSMLRLGVDFGFEYRIYKRGLMFTRLMIGQERYTLKENNLDNTTVSSAGFNFSFAVGIGVKTRSRIRYWAEIMFFSSNAKITETKDLSPDIEVRRNLLGYGLGAGISYGFL